jgi:predicted aminopeptidase
MRSILLFCSGLLVIFGLSSCASLGYYSQAIGGQLTLMRKARPVGDVIADRKQPDTVRKKLEVAQAARRFSFTELKLPRNRSYESYVDVGRPAVVWNVVAVPTLSVTPVQWCFPVAGCFSYRGYFSRVKAERFAAGLQKRGLDTYVAGASAYSTLGWFDDPILSTMLRRSEEDLIATIFHELAHQKLHVAGDSAFNEAFAVTVADEGVRRWYRHRPEVYRRYLEDQERLHAISGLLLETRGRLEALYREPVPDGEKRQRKQAILGALHADYGAMKVNWAGDDRFDGWIPRNINNAHLALIATYQQWVPAFKRLLAREGGDIDRFYVASRKLGRLPPGQRRAALAALTEGGSALRTAAN